MANNFVCAHRHGCGSKLEQDPLCEFVNNECNYGCEECDNYSSPVTCDACDYRDCRNGFKSENDYYIY